MKKDIWLTDKGELIYIDFWSSHDDYARDLLIKENNVNNYYEIKDDFDEDYPYQVLHKRGWVRIRINLQRIPKVAIFGDGIDLTKPMRNTIDPAMNEIQLRIAKFLCKECDTEFHIAINDKRFW